MAFSFAAELEQLEAASFEIEDISSVGIDAASACSSSCSCSSCCSCSTSSCCSTSTSTSSCA